MIISGLDNLTVTIDVDDIDFALEHLNNIARRLCTEKSFSDGRFRFSEGKLPTNRPGLSSIHHTRSIDLDVFLIGFSEDIRHGPKGPALPIYVKFSKFHLWTYGPDYSWSCLEEFIRYLGLTITRSQVSYVELSLHTDEYQFKKAHLNRFITRANKRLDLSPDNQFIGMSFGSSRLRGSIYNKTQRVGQTLEDWFMDIWKSNGWSEDTVVWNIEFQFRRKRLRDMGIDNVTELFSSLNDIWKYCVQDWLVLKNGVRKSTAERPDRIPTNNFWKALGDINFAAPVLPKHAKVEENNKKKCERLIKQGLGCFESASKLSAAYQPIAEEVRTILSLYVKGLSTNS